MKRLLIAATAATLAVGSATAADMRVKAPIASPPPVYSWTGVYFGGFVGGLWSKTDSTFVNPPPGTITQTSNSGVGGGVFGAQAQFEHVVTGLEVGFAAPFNTNFGSGTCNPVAACVAGFTTTQTISNGIFTAGGRAGLAFDRWMVYGSGGYANAQFSQLTCTAGACEGASGAHNGGYFGGGVDVMVYGNWVAGFEYRHYQFDSQAWVPVNTVTHLANPQDTMVSRLRLDTAVFRLTYLFGGPPATPITAKY